MTNMKTTKRALLASILAMVLSIVMMVGTTFAWFTDSVTSANNIITTGTLKVSMDWANGSEAPDAATWTDASEGPIFNNDLWEPGYTEARHIRIHNDGTLALRWNLSIAANGVVSALGDVIDVYYYDAFGAALGANKQVVDRKVTGFEHVGTLTEWLSNDIANGELPAGKTYSATIVLKMREEAGNEYQGLSIGSDFAIQLIATQVDYETDSFDKDYDFYAGMTVVTPENAQEAIHAAQPGDILYLSDGHYDTLVIENADGTSKNGITLMREKAGYGAEATVGAINLNASENITVKGLWFDIAKAQPVYNKSGAATGTYASITGSKAGAARGAKNIVIEGCKFNTTDAYWDESEINPNNYVPICFEEQGRATSRATNITVTGCYLEKEALNFVRMNYMAAGTITITNNYMIPAYGTRHATMVFTGNSANLMIRGNGFYGWKSDKAMLSTSRQGSHEIKIEVTDNTIGNTLTGEGVVLDIKSSYTADNSAVVFENNEFVRGLAGMNETTVPTNKP